MLTNFDIIGATGGPDIAIVKSFTVSTGGTIDIQFPASANNGKVDAIEILQQGSTQLVEDVCQRTNFYYDTNTFNSSFTQYGASRLVAAQYGIPSSLLNTGGSCATPYQFTEMYSYVPGGAVAAKRLTMTTGVTRLSASLDTTQTYDNEGKVVAMKYPDTPLNGSTLTGPTYTYSYDTQGRPIGLVDNQASPVTWVNNVQYGAASELKQMNYGIGAGMLYGTFGAPQSSGMYTEMRTYNNLYQMTNMTVSGVLNMTYTYSATQNNGQITQQTDGISGEQVSYTYDNLNRLITAVTTSSSWGLSFSYDGFGNRTGSTVTKGVAPPWSVAVDPATNRVVGYSYDANGNQTSAPVAGTTLSYDVENRLVSTSQGESYAYTASGQRVWKKLPNGTEELYFYGASGQKLGTYHPVTFTNPASFVIQVADTDISFGGRTIVSRGVAVVRDRLGSNRAGGVKYFPYGEEQVVTTSDKDKFGTYYRDQTTGLDYAQNRYYANTMGRFLTPDSWKVGATNAAVLPLNWNRYPYVGGDPINKTDPSGMCSPEDDPPCFSVTGTAPPDPETNPGDLPGVNDPSSPGVDWIVTVPSPTLPSTADSPPTAPGQPQTPGTPANNGSPQNPCTAKILTAVNNTFGTNFTVNNVQSTFVNGGAFNLVLTGTKLPSGQFNDIQTGRSPKGFLGAIIGYGASLHIVAQGALDPNAVFSNSNIGGVTSVTFTAHIDSAFAYNPIGAIVHYIVDVAGSATRNPCP